MKKIKFISEAYSQQPEKLEITTQEKYEKYKDQERSKYFIKEIKVEEIEIIESVILYYVGYNFEDKIIFQYKADSVNIGYVAI